MSTRRISNNIKIIKQNKTTGGTPLINTYKKFTKDFSINNLIKKYFLGSYGSAIETHKNVIDFLMNDGSALQTYNFMEHFISDFMEEETDGPRKNVFIEDLWDKKYSIKDANLFLEQAIELGLVNSVDFGHYESTEKMRELHNIRKNLENSFPFYENSKFVSEILEEIFGDKYLLTADERANIDPDAKKQSFSKMFLFNSHSNKGTDDYIITRLPHRAETILCVGPRDSQLAKQYKKEIVNVLSSDDDLYFSDRIENAHTIKNLFKLYPSALTVKKNGDELQTFVSYVANQKIDGEQGIFGGLIEGAGAILYHAEKQLNIPAEEIEVFVDKSVISKVKYKAGQYVSTCFFHKNRLIAITELSAVSLKDTEFLTKPLTYIPIYKILLNMILKK